MKPPTRISVGLAPGRFCWRRSVRRWGPHSVGRALRRRRRPKSYKPSNASARCLLTPLGVIGKRPYDLGLPTDWGENVGSMTLGLARPPRGIKCLPRPIVKPRQPRQFAGGRRVCGARGRRAVASQLALDSKALGPGATRSRQKIVHYVSCLLQVLTDTVLVNLSADMSRSV
jgi:hypothetical protein